MATMAVRALLVLVLVGVFSRPAVGAGSYINGGPISSGIPAQNLKMFCVTDMPYNVTTNATTGMALVNNTTHINDAIADCGAAGGGIVYFPPGKYYVNATIKVLKDNVTLMGAGEGASGIYAVENNVDHFVTSTAPLDTALVAIGTQTDPGQTTITGAVINYCWVRDLSLNAVYTGQTSSPINTVLEFTFASVCGCENVVISNSQNGIWFNWFGDCKVEHCRSGDTIKGDISTGAGLLMNGHMNPAFTEGDMRPATFGVGGGCQFIKNIYGIQIAGSAGGVHIEDSEISLNSYGVVIQNNTTSTTSDPDLYKNTQILIGHCAIDTNTNNGIYVKPRALDTLRLYGTWVSSNGLPATPPTGAALTNGIMVESPQITSANTAGSNLLTINIADCRFHRNGGHGLSVQAAQTLNVVGSIFDFNGAYFSTTPPPASTAVFTNGHGINIGNADVLNSTITGNTLTYNGNAGTTGDISVKYGAGLFIAYGVSNVIATGNYTLGNRYLGTTGGASSPGFYMGGSVYGLGVMQQTNTLGGATGGTNRLLSVGTTPALNL